MKPEIHPKLNHVVFVDSSSKAEFATLSTLTSEEKKKINGVDHFVIHVEISSASHPFYTGEKMLIDTAGRVDKFRARMEHSKKMKAEHDARAHKKDEIKKETLEEKITRKAVENTEAKEEARVEAAKPVAKKPAPKPSKPAKKPAAKPAKKAAPAKKPIAKPTKKPAPKKPAKKGKK